MRIIIVIIGGMLLMTSCNQQIINRDSTVCKIDLKKTISPSFYDYFSRVEIIPLETSENSLIKYVGERIYHDSKYYILDTSQKKNISI